MLKTLCIILEFSELSSDSYDDEENEDKESIESERDMNLDEEMPEEDG